eukprot:scaffold16705_cov112-Amphora_coffeaeformis.AAC.1
MKDADRCENNENRKKQWRSVLFWLTYGPFRDRWIGTDLSRERTCSLSVIRHSSLTSPCVNLSRSRTRVEETEIPSVATATMVMAAASFLVDKTGATPLCTSQQDKKTTNTTTKTFVRMKSMVTRKQWTLTLCVALLFSLLARVSWGFVLPGMTTRQLGKKGLWEHPMPSFLPQSFELYANQVPAGSDERKKDLKRRRDIPKRAVKLYVDYAGRLWNETNPEARTKIANTKAAAAIRQVQHIIRGDEYTQFADGDAAAREQLLNACDDLLTAMGNATLIHHVEKEVGAPVEAVVHLSESNITDSLVGGPSTALAAKGEESSA